MNDSRATRCKCSERGKFAYNEWNETHSAQTYSTLVLKVILVTNKDKNMAISLFDFPSRLVWDSQISERFIRFEG